MRNAQGKKINFRCTHERRDPANGLRKARTQYCTGCGIIFESRVKLRNHRNTERCGGRFLPAEEFMHLMQVRKARETLEREIRVFKAHR